MLIQRYNTFIIITLEMLLIVRNDYEALQEVRKRSDVTRSATLRYGILLYAAKRYDRLR